jgi:transcriptional regulator with XRE-family HTH domain
MPLNIRAAFGKRIRELRLKRNLSQEKLAELCGLHTTYVSGIERGQRNVGLVNIVRLAHGLRVKAGELFRGIR